MLYQKKALHLVVPLRASTIPFVLGLSNVLWLLMVRRDQIPLHHLPAQFDALVLPLMFHLIIKYVGEGILEESEGNWLHWNTSR